MKTLSKKSIYTICTLFVLTTLMGCAAKRPSNVPKESDLKKGPYYRFIGADIDFLKGKTKKSLGTFKKLISEFPDAAFLHYTLAQNYVETNQIPEAEEACKTAVNLDPKLVPARVLLGKLYLSEGDVAKAIDIFTKAVEDDPENEENYVLLVRAYLVDNQTSKAIATMKKLLEANPDSIVAYAYLGSTYSSVLNDQEKAIYYYNKALEIEPENLTLHGYIVQLYLQKNQYDKALKKLLEIEEIVPSDISIKLRIALIYYEEKNYVKAAEKLKSILASFPDESKVRYYLGILYESVSDNDKAIEELSKVGPDSSFFKEARLHIAALYHLGGKNDASVESLNQAVKLKSDIPEFYELIAALYEEQNRIKDAIAILESGRKANPNNEKIAFLLGVIYEHEQDRKKAVELMKLVVEINPQNATALNYIGYDLAEKGKKLDQAQEMIERALQLRPNDGYITDSLGWVYFKKGDLEKALEYLTKADKLAPKESTILEHIGEVYLKQNNTEKALEYLEKALDLEEAKPDPDERLLNRIKENIKKNTPVATQKTSETKSGEIEANLIKRDTEIRSLKGFAAVRLLQNNTLSQYDMAVLIEKPDKIRIEAIDDLMGVVASITTNQENVTIEFLQDKTKSLKRAIKFDGEISDFLSILLGSPPGIKKDALTEIDKNNEEYGLKDKDIHLFIDTEGSNLKKIVYYKKYYSKRKWEKKTKYIVLFEDWQTLGKVKFPQKIELSSPADKFSLYIEYKEIKLNENIPPHFFVR